MKKIAYFDCYSGASGDMLLASLLDNAVDFDWFNNEIRKLNIHHATFNLEKTYVQRSAIKSCKINVTTEETHNHHRHLDTINNIIESSTIDENAMELAKKIFLRLAEAEAMIHQVPVNRVHFHEVGALDSIIDIVGFSICYSSLNISKSVVSPIPTGSGQVNCEHGCIPVPAPATLELLKGQKIKVLHNELIHEECLTPTAAAILTTIADECSYLPSMDNVINIGYGAGTKVFHPDVISNLRFVLGSIED